MNDRNGRRERKSCRMVRADLDAYGDADGARLLSAAAHKKIGRHLAGCSACRAEARALRQVIAAVAQFARPEPPPALRERLLAQVHAEAASAPQIEPAQLRPARSEGETVTIRVEHAGRIEMRQHWTTEAARCRRRVSAITVVAPASVPPVPAVRLREQRREQHGNRFTLYESVQTA